MGRTRGVQLEDIGAHYVPTLQAWRKNVADALPQIAALGYPPEFLRLWDFYLCYCEGGFLERSISNVHLLFAKPGWRATLWDAEHSLTRISPNAGAVLPVS